MTININITGLEKLEPYVEKLAAILLGATKNEASVTSGVPAQMSQPQMQEQTVPQIPAQAAMPYPQAPIQNPVSQVPQRPMPAQPQAPVPNNPMAGGLPTSATPQSYSQDQIAVAMTGLADRGMQPQVVAILSAMGCQTLLQVPKERYPELVTKLREVGAAI